MEETLDPAKITVGVVGLGLMGSSIAAALLMAGHRVKAIAPVPGEKEIAPARIGYQLHCCERAGICGTSPGNYLLSLVVSDDFGQLADCSFVLECVKEKVEIKVSIYQSICGVVGEDVIIASNTSAIPISFLQRHVPAPGRFIGVHWAEPAYATRFMEIIRGDQTTPETARRVFALARLWKKEPTLLKKDIRGFITNRLMYSITREALHLVEAAEAGMEDVDKAIRYDMGSWITMMGIFRRMDFQGLKDFPAIFDAVFPMLSNAGSVPRLMQDIVESNVGNSGARQALYRYTEEEARQWEEAFIAFSRDIYHLAAKYPSPVDPPPF